MEPQNTTPTPSTPPATPTPQDTEAATTPSVNSPETPSGATAAAEAGSSPNDSDALDSMTPGQTIVPDSTVPTGGEQGSPLNPMPPVPPIPQTTMPEASDTSEPVPLPVSSTPKKKGLMLGIIVAGVLVLGGGAAAAHYYITNKPANILNRAMANLFDQSKTKTLQFNGKIDLAQTGSNMAMNVTYQGQLDSQNAVFDLSGKLDALVTNITFDLRSVDGKTFYLKLGGLEGLGSLLGATGAGLYASLYQSMASALNNQWLEINESLTKQATGGSLQSEMLSSADRQKLFDAYAQHPFVVIKESLPDEDIKGAKSYHYKLVIDKAKIKDFVAALKKANLSSLKITQEQLEDFNKSVATANFDKYPVDIWIAKSSKMISQVSMKVEQDGTAVNVRFTVDSYNKPVKVEKPEGAKSILEILGNFYDGQDTSTNYLMPDLGTSLSL